MKFICDGLELSESINKVLKATAIRSTNPILEGIKLKAENDSVTLLATDLELSIENKIPADVKIEGEVVVQGKFFAELIRKLANEKIEISKNDNDNTIRLKYTDSEGALQGMSVNEFPEIKKIDSTDHITIKQKDFRELINKTIFSAAYDDTRPILKGILLEVTDGKLNAIALDGYRMAICSKYLVDSTANFNIIVPARSLSEISKIITDNEDDLVINIQKNYILVDLGETKVITRLLDGDFINYKQVLPVQTNTTVTVAKKYLEEAIERASLLARLNKNNLITFDIKDKILTISSTSDYGNINEKVPISKEGKDILVAFNARYFTECMKQIEDEYIKINFTSYNAPCTLTSTENSEYLYLILPVRIGA